MSKPERPDALEAVATELAGEIGDIVRGDTFFRRERRQASDSEAAVERLTSLIQRDSEASVAEIDRAIFELHSMQEMLRSEGERVEREIANYASMSQTAMTSAKTIAAGLPQWRSGVPQVPPAR